jgi:PAS domain S-box-containing protein
MLLDPDEVYRRYLELRQYVGWTEEDARRVHSVAGTLEPHLPALVEDFYREIECHPDTRKAITGGPAQIQRLKGSLLSWLRELLSGLYDRGYALRRWRIGQRHLELGLDQVFVQAGLARLRAGLLRALAASWQNGWPPEGDAICRSLNLLLDLELTKIQDAYHREHVHLAEEHARVQGELAFRALVEAAPCMVIIITAPDQTILYFNPFAEEVSGYPAAEVLGKNVAQLLNGQEFSAWLAWEHGTEFERPMRCKDGSRRWVVWNSERLGDFRGRPANLLVGLDRTELKDAQQRAWQTERLAELGVLASGLAHEIRNPLNTIRFNLLNVQDGMAQPQTDHTEIAAMVKDIADEVDRLEEIMRNFLRLARPDPVQLEAVDVRELLECVARLVDGPCRAQDVELSWECSSDARAAADPNQLKQVLLNLVLNAQQAMPQGGRLNLRCLAPAEALLIEVADTGPGIPDGVRDKLFQPFFSTKKEGTGLGLSICRRLVEQMHGRLDFTTQPGKGTTFVVRLPRAAQ